MTARACIVLLVCLAVLPALPAAGARDGREAKVLTLTERGVDGVRLGRTLAQVRATGRIGPTGLGCELVSPRPLFARLKPPLKGFVTFDGKAPHRVVALDLVAGVQTTRHIRVADRAAKVRRAYPEATLLTSRRGDPIQITALIVKHGGKQRIWFLLNGRNASVVAIDLPGPQICE